MTARQRLKKINVNLGVIIPDFTLKQVVYIILTCFGALATLASGFHCQTAKKQDTLIAKQDTVLHSAIVDTTKSRKVVIADLDTIKNSMRVILATLNNLNVVNSDLSEKQKLDHKADSAMIKSLLATVGYINQTLVTHNAEIAVMQRQLRQR